MKKNIFEYIIKDTEPNFNFKKYKFLKNKKPHLVILAAAKVGGIIANSKYKDEFLYQNLQIHLKF